MPQAVSEPPTFDALAAAPRPSAPPASAGSERGGAPPTPARGLWLPLLMTLAVLVPTLFFLFTAWQARERAFGDAAARVSRSAVIAREHGLKLMHMNGVLLQQLVRGNLSAAELDGLVRGLPDVRALVAWDAAGRLLSGAGDVDPVLAGGVAAEAFFAVHRDREAGLFVSEPVQSRLRPQEWQLIVSQRRTAPDGSFDGVAAVVLHEAAFENFYRDLLRTERSGTVALVRVDGMVIARQPPAPVHGIQVPPGHALTQAMQRGEVAGLVDAVSPIDQRPRRIAFRRLDGYPLYATASIEMAEVAAGWHREVALLAAFTFPTALGLAAVTWLARRHQRRERNALEQWRAETVKRTQAEDALRQTQRLEALGHLTGGVAHDVNNLLMVVSNNAYLLRRLLTGPLPPAALARAEKPIDAILRAVTTGSRLTRQLLAFARRQALRPQPLQLQERLPLLLELMGHSVSATITLEGHCAPDTEPVEVDPAELELAMINLAVNARDAMPDGGRLTVQVRNATPGEHEGLGHWVSITVSDTGRGIPAEVLDRVFEPFFTTKEQGKGTGLGLSQVYGFCQQAGGTARIRSRVGEGTEVQLLLPATRERVEALAIDAPAVQSAEGRLLLVEDNAEVADATEPMLSSWGYAVKLARNGDAAKELLQQLEGGFDLLLTDIVMPGSTDGLTLARHVRTLFPQIGIVLMTGHARETDKAMAEGFVVLQKPWTPQALAAALQQAHPKQRAATA